VNPDLLTPQNERLEEHYGRRAEVRRNVSDAGIRQRLTYHSTFARALQAFDDRRQEGDFVTSACEQCGSLLIRSIRRHVP